MVVNPLLSRNSLEETTIQNLCIDCTFLISFSSSVMDLSQPTNPIFSAGGGIVLPRHPATPPANMSPPTKVSSASNGTQSNAKAAFFSITNLVNGLRQQQQQENSENGENASKGRNPYFYQL